MLPSRTTALSVLLPCLLMAAFVHSAPADIIYNANSAFVQNELGGETPVFGPFSVGHFDEAVPGGFTAFTAGQHTDNFFHPEIQGFRQQNGYQIPAAVVNTNTTTSVTTSYGATLDPSQILLHPGGLGVQGNELPFHNAILRFTAPVTADYRIQGDWESFAPSQPMRTQNSILVNGSSVFSSTLNASVFDLTESLSAGDTVDFVVNDNGDIFGDSTGLRATLTASNASVPEPSSAGLLLAIGAAFQLAMVRRRRNQSAALILLCVALSGGTSQAAIITISDTEFSSSDWNVHELTVTNASQTAAQLPVGGNPDNFRSMSHTLDPGASSLFVFHEFTGSDYTPSTDGLITSLDYAEDQIRVTSFGAIGANPALMQNGTVYVGPDITFSNDVWNTTSLLGLSAADFDDGGGGNPDFSLTGSVISFGYRRWNTSAGNLVKDHGIDNWSVTLQTSPSSVPEPGSMAFLGIMTCLGAGILKRRRSALREMPPRIDSENGSGEEGTASD